MRFDRLWRGGVLATLSPARPGLGLIPDGAVGAKDGRIVFAGPLSDLPPDADAAELIELEGRLVTPGLIDCHTHLVFAGDRADEFEQRMAGASYEAIAEAGGGILSTVRATRAASEEALVASALQRLDRLIAEGVTTIEVKSGYGLELNAELKMLRVARQLGRERPVEVVTSLLGAHALPPEYAGDRAGYVALVVGAMIPQTVEAGLVDMVDAFCEALAFSPDEVRRVFAAARAAGLPVRLHADQRTAGGGAKLAAELGALCADHLEWTDDAGAAAMARAGTTAVLLPGAFYALRDQQRPPVGLFRSHGVGMAVATDCNPGSSPLVSILTAMNMAVILFGLTVEEAVAGVTLHAARALGRQDSIGSLEVGKQADLAIWNAVRPVELVYWMGASPLHSRVWKGEPSP